MPDTCPFYSTSTQELEADPGWGIAAWIVPTQFASYYDDDRLEEAFYPNQKAYMEHWIRLAQTNSGELPSALQHSGDWGCLQPGPMDCAPKEYAHYFYVTALALQAACATRLGLQADVARYTGLLKAAQQLYLDRYFHNATGCFGNCSDISQIFGLSLSGGDGLMSASDEAKAWKQALAWFGKDGKYDGRFGGGIVSLKLLYPLLDKFGKSDLGLAFQLHTDKAPSFGYWMAQGATTLWEFWGNSEFTFNEGLNSYNHIMYGGTGSWYYSTLAGLRRAAGSRSWSDLIIAPPAPGSLGSNLTWANASVDTPMGVVRSAWSVTAVAVGDASGLLMHTLHAILPPNARGHIAIPAAASSSAFTIQEGGATVWEAGQFVNNGAISGIVSAKATPPELEGGSSPVVFEVGSGSFVFTSCCHVGII